MAGVRVEMPGNVPVMFLTETEGEGRTLPIYIGNVEAKAIVDALEGRLPDRPLTHDLLVDTIIALGATVEKVVIVALREMRPGEFTYFAELRLLVGGRPVVVSARPSDSVALAVRIGAEIEIDSALLDQLEEEGTLVIWTDDLDEDDDEPEEPEELVDEFRQFLEDLNPEDFS